MAMQRTDQLLFQQAFLYLVSRVVHIVSTITNPGQSCVVAIVKEILDARKNVDAILRNCAQCTLLKTT